MLKVKIIQQIDCSDWDDLVKQTYGKPYHFQQQEGCQERGAFTINIPEEFMEEEEMNDSIPEEINGYEMGVKFDVWLARDPKEWNGLKEDERFIDFFWHRNFYPNIQTVANDLHAKGLIEAGKYDIKIDW